MFRNRKSDYKERVNQVQSLLFFIRRSNNARSGPFSNEEKSSVDALLNIIESELVDMWLEMFTRQTAVEELRLRRRREQDAAAEAKNYRKKSTNGIPRYLKLKYLLRLRQTSDRDLLA